MSNSQESLSAASLVRLLSIQTEKLDLLLQTNEAAQKEIHQLQQRNDCLRQKCASLEHSEEQKAKKISSLEKKVDDLEKLVIEMKLNEAQCRSREDHYKLQAAKLDQLLDEQRNDSKFSQSLMTLSSNTTNVSVKSVENPEPDKTRSPLLNLSFSSFFGKSDKFDKSCSRSSRVVMSKPSIDVDDSLEAPKELLLESIEDEKIMVSRTIEEEWCNPDRIENSISKNNDTSHKKEAPISKDSKSRATPIRPPDFISVPASPHVGSPCARGKRHGKLKRSELSEE